MNEPGKEMSEAIMRYGRHIAFIAVYFNGIEEILNTILLPIINNKDDFVGIACIDSIPFQSKVNLYEKLALRVTNRTSNIRLNGKISALCESMRNAGKTRNEIIHSVWVNYSAVDEKVLIKRKADRDGTNTIEKTMNLDTFDKALELMITIWKDLSAQSIQILDIIENE